MTNSELFKAAHIAAKADRAFDARHSYAYYFRLQLINLQYWEKDKKIVAAGGLVRGFQIVEPRRIWA